MQNRTGSLQDEETDSDVHNAKLVILSRNRPEPNDVSEVPGLVTGSDDKSAEQGERPSTHVTSIPVGAQPEERCDVLQRH